LSKTQEIIVRDRAVAPSRIARLVTQVRGIWSGPITSNSPELARYWGATPNATGVPVNEWTALNYSAVWSAVARIAGDISSLPLFLYRRTKDGGKERYDAHPLYRLLHDQPNPEMTSMVWRRTLQAHALTWGNAYAEIVRDGGGRVIELWPITPDRVLPQRDGRGLFYRVSNPSGGEIVILPEDMLHLHGLGYDGVLGYSVIHHARESLGLGMATERFGGTFFGNGSTFGGILSHPSTLTEPARKNLRESIDSRHQGVDRAHRFIILEEGLKYEKLGIPPNDAQFLETRKFQLEEVARWFNIPPHKLGALDRATHSNIEQQETDYYISSLGPWLQNWEQELTAKLIARSEVNIQLIEHNLEGKLRGDSTARGEFYSKNFSVAAFTPNEIRAVENRSPIAGGDEAFVPLNLIPLNLVRPYWEAQIEAKKAPPSPPNPQASPTDAAMNREDIAKLIDELATARRLTQEKEDALDRQRQDVQTLRDEKTQAQTVASTLAADLATERAAHAESAAQCAVADATIDATRLDLEVKTAEILTLQDRVVETGVLLREVLLDVLNNRLVHKETERARKQQGSPDKLLRWVDSFYTTHAEFARLALRPAVRAWCANRGTAQPDMLLDALVAWYIEQSAVQLRLVAQDADEQTLAPALERVLRRWETDRAETILEWLHHHGDAA
jgi:HK97 family phage portal protein